MLRIRFFIVAAALAVICAVRAALARDSVFDAGLMPVIGLVDRLFVSRERSRSSRSRAFIA